MYARTLTQQSNNPPKLNDVKTCNLFFHFWPWFWCACLRRDAISSFKFCLIFYNKSLISTYFSCDFAIDLNTNFVFIFSCNYLRRADFLCFNFCSNFNEKSSILACFFMQLASACCRIDKQADDLFVCLSIRRHAKANCIEKHVKIDMFSLKFEQKLKHEKSSRRR